MTETTAVLPAHPATRDLPEIRFPQGLPGFPDSRRFALVRWGAQPALSVLVDLDLPEIRFLVAPPDVFFAGYTATLDDGTCALLDLHDPAHALLLTIINLADGGVPTANLLGPIVINVGNRTGVQAVLSDSTYAARTPLPGAEHPSREGAPCSS